MSDFQYIPRLLITIVFTIYIAISTLIVFLFNYLKNPFASPFANKLRLLPPPIFADPKYGVHQYIRLNHARIHYMESGDSSKPLIIFLHGFSEFWYSWRHQIVEFKKDYWCVAVDIRGFGDSEKSEGLDHYKLKTLVEDLRCLIEYLGREQCILVAHDVGGMIACAMRDKHPELISAVVLLASSSIEAWFNEIWNNWNQMIKSWYIFLFNLPWLAENWMLLNNMVFLEKLMLTSRNKRITKDDVECYKYWTGKPSLQTAALSIYRANFLLNCKKKEVKCNVPMFAIHAANDTLLEASVLRTLKEEYPNLETNVVDVGGHCIQQEEPDMVNKMIKDFLIKHNLH